jgi:hypothetical protein
MKALRMASKSTRSGNGKSLLSVIANRLSQCSFSIRMFIHTTIQPRARSSQRFLARVCGVFAPLAVAMLTGLNVLGAYPNDLPVSVAYQPMTATGLAAEHPFDAWFVLDKSADPSVPGYEVPAGATIRVTFPKQSLPSRGIRWRRFSCTAGRRWRFRRT